MQQSNLTIKKLSIVARWLCLSAGLIGTFLAVPSLAESRGQPKVVWDDPSNSKGYMFDVLESKTPAFDRSAPANKAVPTQPKVELKAGEMKETSTMDQMDLNESQPDSFFESTSPPSKSSKVMDIYLENKGITQGYLTGFTTERADIDLKLQQFQPSDISADSKFQISNFGKYIRIGHESTSKVIGYSINYFGFTNVYLEKDYFEPREFKSRFKIAPSGLDEWYLIRSYSDSKKCLTIGWNDQLRLKRCNIKDKWQQWRFLREKSDAYWVPETKLLDLDII